MREILIKLIKFLHILFIMFVLITPASNSNYMLMLHLIFVPFMMIHWLCNDNTCALTIVERRLRQFGSSESEADQEDDDCFTCRLIEPVYDFKKDNGAFSIAIYIITTILMLISAGKLFCKYRSGEIASYQDLFIV